MSANLANVYAALLRKYGDSFTLTYTQPPSYLTNIVGPEEMGVGKIIFVYLEDQDKRLKNYVSPVQLRSKGNGAECADLDLTGSPLKDDCVIDAIADLSLDLKIDAPNPWSLEEECHKGIGVEKARAIICTDDFQHGAASADELGSVWLLCSGADVEKTLLLQYEFTCDYFSRGSVVFRGVVPAQTVNSQTLLRQHSALMRSHNARVETYVENTYQMKSNISIRCSWSTQAALPSLIDLATSDVVLRQKFRLGACNPLTEDLIVQLKILVLIRDDILVHKKGFATTNAGRELAMVDMALVPVVYRGGCGIDMAELREGINKAMTEVSGFGEMDDDSGTECDIEAVVQRVKLRRLNDLTDKLWELLKRCASYKDLKMGFQIIFQCAARCNIVNTPTNKNRLAEIITEVANRRLAIPCLTGTEPLELLLEIGLEKLYKDYELIFAESKICSANDLKNKSIFEAQKDDASTAMPNVRKSLHNAVCPEADTMRKTLLHNTGRANNNNFQDVLGFKNSNFDEQQTGARLAKLLQVHCTLEHLLIIHVHLSLSNVYSDVCDQLLRRAPPLVDAVDDTLTDEIEISLSAHDVREHLEGKDPHSRRITMRSKNKYREVKSTFYYSVENVCPPGVSECFQSDDKETIKDNTYFSWLYRKIKTLHTQ